ncbi:HAD family hydrolase [Bradyrhizobium prioriisuperbiae]|uniref:HAD family hydrolase n=1 Tax=Bradyrhizobium prioriisuperbiae TaxID=2854389 RepID=UPI0028EB45A0|nr:HAD family hydrolase [Bradyrhizobium prioritasuperba]
MITPDLIIFDCDGVLVDSEVLSCRCLSEVLAGYGITIGTAEIVRLFLGRNTAAVVQHYADAGRPIPSTFPDDFAAKVRETFQAALRPIEGIAGVLEGLQQDGRHIPYCLASSSALDRVSLSLSLTRLASYFGGRLYTSQMVKHGKPAPDLFLYAAERMGAEPRHTLVIEDSVSGVTAGKAAGMQVWGFVGGGHYGSHDGRGPLVEAGADRVFDRMADFWRADR